MKRGLDGGGITGKDNTAGDVRAVSAKCKVAKAAQRMSTIAMIRVGYDRQTAMRTFGMSPVDLVIGLVSMRLDAATPATRVAELVTAPQACL